MLFSFNVVAEESNRNRIRAELSDGWSVVWGHNFTEGDWVEGLAAISASIATESPGPFLKWFDYKIQQNIDLIMSRLPGVLRSSLYQWIVESLEKKRIIVYRNFRIDAGFATYSRWQTVIYDEPHTYQCKQYYDYPCPTITKAFRTCEGWTWSVCM